LREGSRQNERSVPKPQDHSEKNAPPIVPERGAVDRLAGVVPQLPTEPLAQDAPLEVPLPEVNTLLAAGSNERPKVEERQGIPLNEFVANVFRKQVLDPASVEEGPLGQADAVAALDKGLRTVGVRRFDLRLGRNFAISASR
jgi:hypothetical protein